VHFIFVLIYTLTSFAEPLLNVEQVIGEKSVPTGEELKGELVLNNKGDELLKIQGGSSTCTALSGGSLKCWGNSNDGRLGNSNDSSNDVYLTGFTTGNLENNTNSGSGDIFLIKYNSSGVLK